MGRKLSLPNRKLLIDIKFKDLNNDLTSIKTKSYRDDVIQFYPNFFCNSYIIKCFSVLELNLFEVCDVLLLTRGVNLKTDRDINGKSTLDKAKKCLENILGIYVSKEKWEELDRIRIIRNAIIHKDSIISTNVNKQLKDYFALHNLESSFIYDIIVTNFDYCRYITDYVQNFFDELFAVIDNKDWRKKNIASN